MGRSSNKLSVLEIKKDLPPGLYGDGGGLYLQVSKQKTKAWVFRFMMAGVARKMGLGAVSLNSNDKLVTLAEARKKAQAAHNLVVDGIDPIDQRDAKRAAEAVHKAKALTFKQCADKYIAAHEGSWRNEKHKDQWKSTFSETARGTKKFPALTAAINDLPVAAIDTGTVLQCLEPIWTTKPETAARARGRIESVLNWATTREYRSGENPARWRGHLENVLPRRSKVRTVKHHPAMPYADVPAYMRRLRSQESVSARALEFTILCASRTGEVIGAEWSEIDFEAKAWTIPGIRMKGGKDHRVPLSDRAIQILEAMPREGKFVFPGAKAKKPLSNMAMLEMLRGAHPDLTVHGFRSSFRDWAEEQTAYSANVIEMSLAHVIGDKVEAAYRRGELFEKRQRLMEDWSIYCVQSSGNRGSNVVAMRATL